MKFLLPNYSCLQNPRLRGYHPQIPVLSVLNWICWTPLPRKKFLCTPLMMTNLSVQRCGELCPDSALKLLPSALLLSGTYPNDTDFILHDLYCQKKLKDCQWQALMATEASRQDLSEHLCRGTEGKKKLGTNFILKHSTPCILVVNHFFVFQLNVHNMLNTYIYH